MKKQNQNNEKEKNIFSFLDHASEVVGWLQIVLSLLILGLIIAAVLYFTNPSTLRFFIAFPIGFAGLIVGIVIANKACKSKGTIHAISTEMATPELNTLEDENDRLL